MARVKAKNLPLQTLFDLVSGFRLVVIDGEAFTIRGKVHRHVKKADYEALIEHGWIIQRPIVAEGLILNEITEEGRNFALRLEEERRKYHQLKFADC